jgi:hypothetical protein
MPMHALPAVTLMQRSEFREPAFMHLHIHEFREPTHDQIAIEAYFRWRGNGSSAGDSQRDWFAAEAVLMQRQAAGDGITWTKETSQNRIQ